jgi:hypothetical protein
MLKANTIYLYITNKRYTLNIILFEIYYTTCDMSGSHGGEYKGGL